MQTVETRFLLPLLGLGMRWGGGGGGGVGGGGGGGYSFLLFTSYSVLHSVARDSDHFIISRIRMS